MLEESWKCLFFFELEIKCVVGLECVVLVLGNYGECFVCEQMGIDLQMVVIMSNFVGYMIEEVVWFGFCQIVFIGYFGKLIKIVVGIFYIYSYIVDVWMEIFVVYLVLFGVLLLLLMLVSECDIIEVVMEYIDVWGYQCFYNYLVE